MYEYKLMFLKPIDNDYELIDKETNHTITCYRINKPCTYNCSMFSCTNKKGERFATCKANSQEIGHLTHGPTARDELIKYLNNLVVQEEAKPDKNPDFISCLKTWMFYGGKND